MFKRPVICYSCELSCCPNAISCVPLLGPLAFFSLARHHDRAPLRVLATARMSSCSVLSCRRSYLPSNSGQGPI